jgi:hypothetical protein
MKKKKNYEQPETAVTRVELESPICTGSTKFVGEEASGVNISEQTVTTPDEVGGRTLNDFSNSQWGSDIQ